MATEPSQLHRILRRDRLNKRSPLTDVVQSFFVSNYGIAPRTKDFYTTYFTGYGEYIRASLWHEPLIDDLNQDYVN